MNGSPLRWIDRAESAGVRLVAGADGLARLVGRGYERAVTHDAAFLDALAAARGPAGLVEDLLLEEEPDRIGTRVRILLDALSPSPPPLLHWASASLAATIAIARAGVAYIDAYESNPLWEPIARARVRQAGLGDRIRVLAPDDDPGMFDLVLLIGDRAHRRPPLPPPEAERLARSVRPGGVLLIVGWGAGISLPTPLDRWPVRRGTSGGAAAIRWKYPRGRAPVPRAWRRWSGWTGQMVAPLLPDVCLWLLGERDLALGRPEDGDR